MYLKKVLNQPNLVGTVLIALMVCSGFVYAFAFDGFNVETVTGGEVEEWLDKASGKENYNKNCTNNACVQSWAGCTGSATNPCTNCTHQSNNCAMKKGKSKCKHTHPGCGTSSDPKCPFNSGGSNKYCSSGGNSCPSNCNRL